MDEQEAETEETTETEQKAETEAAGQPEEAGTATEAEAGDRPEEAAAEAETGTSEPPAKPSVVTHVDETGPCTRLIAIEVPREKVGEEIDASYEELRKTVFIKGFRRGRIPRHVLERRFREQVLEGVRQALVDEAYGNAIAEHSLRVALAPTIDYKAIPFEADKPLSFEVTVEVAPEFTIDNYRGLTVERPDVEVTPEDVDRALESFRMRRGEYRKIEEGEVAEGDVPVCHAIAIQDGEEVWRETELGADLSSGVVAGIRIEGLKDALLGAKPGETRAFSNVALPGDFAAEALRGKQVDLEVTVDELRRFDAPEATDEWARSLRFDGLDDLLEELYDELRRRREQEADDVVQTRIAEKLLELTAFDVPEGLVERMVGRSKERQRLELLYRGVPREELDKVVEEGEKSTRESSTRQCKLYFVYEKVAEQEKIFVTEDELQQRIQAIALNYRRRPEELQAELEREGRLGALRQQMREEKVRDFLVQHANIIQAGAAEEAGAAAEAPSEPAAAPEEPAQEEAPDEEKAEGGDA